MTFAEVHFLLHVIGTIYNVTLYPVTCLQKLPTFIQNTSKDFILGQGYNDKQNFKQQLKFT